MNKPVNLHLSILDLSNNFAITKSIYKDKNNSKFKNKLVKAFHNTVKNCKNFCNIAKSFY